MATYTTPEQLQQLSITDPELQQILDDIGAFPSSWENIPKMREEMALAAQQKQNLFNGQPSDVRPWPVTMRDGHRDEILIVTPHTPPAGGSPMIVLVFGGGFVVGAKEDMLPYAQVFSQHFGATVACVTYRRAPEYKFPTAPQDVWDCFETVIENAQILGASTSAGFIIGGISAGANLAAVTARRAVEQGTTLPLTGVWLCIPAVMDEKTVPEEYKSVWLSRKQNANAIILNAEALDYVQKYYQWDGASPDFSPLAWPSAPKNVPPTFFQVCGQDPLRDDGLIYERILRSAGVSTKLEVYPGVPHGFNGFASRITLAKKFEQDILSGMAWLLKPSGA